MEKVINKNLKHFTGKFVQKYPMYSSKTVGGRQLFEYARAGEIVDTPEREVFVKKLKFVKLRKISSVAILANIEKRVGKVKGDFRQKEIMNIWRKKFRANKSQKFFIANFKIKCSSGTYVRGIANSLGEKMRLPALAFSIKRTKIGKWAL